MLPQNTNPLAISKSFNQYYPHHLLTDSPAGGLRASGFLLLLIACGGFYATKINSCSIYPQFERKSPAHLHMRGDFISNTLACFFIKARLNAINANTHPRKWYLVVFVPESGRFGVQNFWLVVPVTDGLRYNYHTVLIRYLKASKAFGQFLI